MLLGAGQTPPYAPLTSLQTLHQHTHAVKTHCLLTVTYTTTPAEREVDKQAGVACYKGTGFWMQFQTMGVV